MTLVDTVITHLATYISGCAIVDRNLTRETLYDTNAIAIDITKVNAIPANNQLKNYVEENIISLHFKCDSTANLDKYLSWSKGTMIYGGYAWMGGAIDYQNTVNTASQLYKQKILS
jgi:hypothetical protein